MELSNVFCFLLYEMFQKNASKIAISLEEEPKRKNLWFLKKLGLLFLILIGHVGLIIGGTIKIYTLSLIFLSAVF